MSSLHFAILPCHLNRICTLQNRHVGLNRGCTSLKNWERTIVTSVRKLPSLQESKLKRSGCPSLHDRGLNIFMKRKPFLVFGTPVMIVARAQHAPPPKRDPRPRQPKVITEEREPQQQDKMRQTSVQEISEETWKKQQQQEQRQWEDLSQQTAADALTPQVSAYVSKVYRFMAGTVAVAGATGIASAALGLPGMGLLGLLGGLGLILGVVFTPKEKVRLREGLVLGFGALSGLTLGPLLASVSASASLLAFLGTLGIFAGFSLAALRAKRTAYIYWTGPLFGALLITFLVGITGALLPLFGVHNLAILKALYNVNLYLGLGLFSVFVAYDTQRMIDSAARGEEDHVSDALNMFMNVFNIFIRLLMIFGRKDD